MGGSTGGRIPSSDLRKLEERASQRLKEAVDQSTPNAFISFSAKDLNEVNLLRGQAKNDNSDVEFSDYSVKSPYNSTDADYIKRKIREKIDLCSVTVVYLSENAATSKWVNWEIKESLKQGKGVIGTYSGNTPPTSVPPAFSEAGCTAVKWGSNLSDAIKEARETR